MKPEQEAQSEARCWQGWGCRGGEQVEQSRAWWGFLRAGGHCEDEDGGMPDSGSGGIPLTFPQWMDQQYRAGDMRPGAGHGLSPGLEGQGPAWDGGRSGAEEGHAGGYWGPKIKVTWRQHQWRRGGIQDGARFPGGNGDISEVGSMAGGAHLV